MSEFTFTAAAPSSLVFGSSSNSSSSRPTRTADAAKPPPPASFGTHAKRLAANRKKATPRARSAVASPDDGDMPPAARKGKDTAPQAPTGGSQSAFEDVGGLFAARDAPGAPKPRAPPVPGVAALKLKRKPKPAPEPEPEPEPPKPARPIRKPFEKRTTSAAPAPAPAPPVVDISTADLSAIMRRVKSASAAPSATPPPPAAGRAQTSTTPAGWPLGFSVMSADGQGPVLAPVPVPAPPALGVFARLAPAERMTGFMFGHPAAAVLEPEQQQQQQQQAYSPPLPGPPEWYSPRPVAVAISPVLSPQLGHSPLVLSPQRVDSPQLWHSPPVVLGPQRVDSPQLGYSPPVVLGPQRVGSPQRDLSPLMGFSGLQLQLQQAPSSPQPIPVPRPIAPQPPPAPAAPPTTTTTTTLPPIPLRPHLTAPSISLDELTTTWTQSLETHTALFAQHAAAVRRLDHTLHTHHSRIDALSLSATTADHSSRTLDRALDALAADQTHLCEVLAWYGALLDTELGWAAAAAAAVDAEREGIMGMAVGVAEGVDALVGAGAEMVAALNEVGAVGVGAQLGDVVQILNNHLSALEWIDGRTAALRAKIMDAQRNIPDLDGDGDEDMRRMFYSAPGW